MSTGIDPAPSEPDGLQFDHAEFEQPAPSTVGCAACKRPIVDQYFEINGTIVCEPCKDEIATRLKGGSGFVRFLRALVFGSGAAIVGIIAYVLIFRATKGEFGMGLLLILLAYLIGRAVRTGSRNLGGKLYQFTAALLSYLAIGAAYTAIAFAQLIAAAAPGLPPDTLSRLILFVVITIVAPVTTARESVFGIVIVGFALWQAWKTNVKLRLVVTGPYRVGEAGPEGAIEGTPAHA